MKNTPTFFPSVSSNEDTWAWRYGVPVEGALIALDVLKKVAASRSRLGEIRKVLGFDGPVILDNGAFGSSTAVDPRAIFAEQAARRPAVAIILDRPTAGLAGSRAQAAIRETVSNARTISRLNSSPRLKLMAVVQGNSPKAARACAKKLASLEVKYLGVPLSQYSKKRDYKPAIQKIKAISASNRKNLLIHGLGCGSRTLIALLVHFGVRYFDSSSYYKLALRGRTYEPEQFCSIGAPHSKPECNMCLRRQRLGDSFRARCKFNLVEIMKEIQRCRCALQKGATREYLMKTRIPTSRRKDLEPLL